MIVRIKKLVRKNKGMEALQAVILLGAGFLIVWGLMAAWNGVAPDVNSTTKDIISGKGK